MSKLFPEIEDEYDAPRVPEVLTALAPLKLVLKITVLWEGWESDSAAWIITDRHAKVFLVATSHGAPFLASKDFLLERQAAYRRVADETEAALRILNGAETAERHG